MPRVGFEPTIPVFERMKTVHASGRGHCDRRLTSLQTDISVDSLSYFIQFKQSVTVKWKRITSCLNV
jgi:hypothetical protein